jgi:protein-tyrosine phosphatase
MSGGVDFHNHVIPGVDDGAVDEAEATAALSAFEDQGITRIIATPHVAASLTRRPALLAERLAAIDAGWARLRALIRDRFPDLEVSRGAEVMLDTPEPDLGDARLRLAGSRFALVEYPFMAVPPRSTEVLARLVRDGVTPVVAHPERYAGITPELTRPTRWRSAGALLQVNAGSLTGRYGPSAHAHVLALLERGMADYMCSDFHARGQPATAAARRLLEEMGAAEQGELLTIVNPGRLLAGADPLPVPPLRVRRSVWQRLTRWWG